MLRVRGTKHVSVAIAQNGLGAVSAEETVVRPVVVMIVGVEGRVGGGRAALEEAQTLLADGRVVVQLLLPAAVSAAVMTAILTTVARGWTVWIGADEVLRLVADAAVEGDVAHGVVLQGRHRAIRGIRLHEVHEAVATLAMLFLR